MIKVYVGPMFSGKTAAIFNAYSNIWNKENTMCFKPKIDTRDIGVIKTRIAKEKIKAICINDISEIKKHLKKDTKTVFIDEAQFLTGDVRELLNLSIIKNIDFHINGLPTTGEQKPFGIMPNLMAIADEIQIYKAVCFDCNRPAQYTFFKGLKTEDILIGSDEYLPLCGDCLLKRRKKQKNIDWLKK